MRRPLGSGLSVVGSQERFEQEVTEVTEKEPWAVPKGSQFLVVCSEELRLKETEKRLERIGSLLSVVCCRESPEQKVAGVMWKRSLQGSRWWVLCSRATQSRREDRLRWG